MTATGSQQASPYRIVAEDGQAVARPTSTTTCSICGGRGTLSSRDDLGYERVRPCECQLLQRRIELFNRAGVPGLFADSSFGTFRPATDNLGDAAQAARDLVRGYAPGSRGLCLLGTVGVGKTHLAVAIIRELTLNRGVTCRFCDNLQLLQDLKLAYEKREGTAELLEPLATVDVLVVDDLGKGRGSDWEITILDDMISRRYNASATTIVTTNYLEKATKHEGVVSETLQRRVGDRIYSRLHGMCTFLEMEGQDFRRTRATRRGRL